MFLGMKTMNRTALFLIIYDPEFHEVRPHLRDDLVMSFEPNPSSSDEGDVLSLPRSAAFMGSGAQHALASASEGGTAELLACYERAATLLLRRAIKREKRHRR